MIHNRIPAMSPRNKLITHGDFYPPSPLTCQPFCPHRRVHLQYWNTAAQQALSFMLSQILLPLFVGFFLPVLWQSIEHLELLCLHLDEINWTFWQNFQSAQNLILSDSQSYLGPSPLNKGVPPWPSGLYSCQPDYLYSCFVLSHWRKALVRVTAAPPSYVFPLLELVIYSWLRVM